MLCKFAQQCGHGSFIYDAFPMAESRRVRRGGGGAVPVQRDCEAMCKNTQNLNLLHYILEVMKKIILLFLMSISYLSPISSKPIFENTFDKEDFIKEISYQYQLIENKNGRLECIGTLYLTLSLTDDIESIMFERTSPYASESRDPMFLAKRILSLETSPIPVEDITWKIKFRLVITYKDGSHIISNVYNINDYIDEADLKLLYDSSDVSIIEDSPYELSIENGRIIHCHTSTEGRIDIFDLNGNCIYTTKTHGSDIIDLDELNTSNSSIIIIRLQLDEKTIIKKIRIR